VAPLLGYLPSVSFNQPSYTIKANNLNYNYVDWSLDSAYAHSSLPIAYIYGTVTSISINSQASVPIPAAIWLVGCGLLGLFGFAHRKAT